MKKLISIKNNQLIKLFGALFMTLNLIMVVIGSLSCIYTVSAFKKVIAEYNMSNIENVRSLMDIRLSSGEKLAQDIYLSVNLGDLAQETTFETPEARLRISKLMSTIGYGVDTNSVITSAYIYLAKSKTIVSNGGFYEASFFYENYVPHKELPFEQWIAQLNNTKLPCYHNVTLDFENYEVSLTEYRKPINPYATEDYGCVVINYNNQAIAEILEKSLLLGNASTQITYRPTGESLISTGDGAVIQYVKEREMPTGQHFLQHSPIGNLIVIQQNSLNQDWEFMTAIPTDVFYGKISAIIGIMIAIILLQILLGTVLAMLFSKRSYRPIRHMTDKIRAMAGDFSVQDSGDDIEDIQNITQKAIGDYDEIREELETIKPMVIKSFLTQLLHGNSCERDYADNNFAQTQELFQEEGFICAKIYIEDCTDFVTDQSIAEMQLAKLVLTNVADELFEGKMTMMSLDFDLSNVVLVFNVPWIENKNETSIYFETIEKTLKRYQALLVEKLKIYTSIGVSRLHQSLQSLYQCHNQAQQALNEKIVSGMYGINYYTEQAAGQHAYSYSLEDEMYLISGTKTGNFAKVKEILDGIIEENKNVFSNGSLPVAQCFMIDLVSTLLRVVSETNIPAQVLPYTVSELLAVGSYAKMVDELYRCYKILCDWINKNKKSHNTGMKDKIVTYIKEHCLDNSLSLVSVADYMNVNPTYLSVFIKEQLGETFLNYVLLLRMEKAKDLLETTELSLQDIAVRIGYANSGVFIRVFKKKYGHTPGSYRQTKM